MKNRSLHSWLINLILSSLIMCSLVGAQQSTNVQNAESLKVFFDHLYIVVDGETYTAIKESDLIRNAFCMYSEDTVSNLEESWAGAYLHGEMNYIEIFRPGGFEDAKEGTVGLGFSTTREGDIDTVCKRYKEHFGDGIETELTHFEMDTLEFPWFYVLESDTSEGNRVAAWVMEYHPKHLQFMGVVPDSTGSITREAYMTAMNSMLAGKTGQSHEEMLFNSITAISLVMIQSELDRLSMELAAMSYTMEVENNVTSFHGSGIVISCTVKSDPRYRVQSLSFSLSRKPENETVVQLGPTSVLTISTDGTGQWTFADDL